MGFPQLPLAFRPHHRPFPSIHTGCGGWAWDREEGAPHSREPRKPASSPQIHEWGVRRCPRLQASSNAGPSPTQGQIACEQIRAALYLECSAKFRENVEDVFRAAAKVALSALKKAQRQKQHRLCLLL